MRYIFKNYLKTFIKNWIQTIGTILFIMMMVTIVIGMLSSPLQISNIVNNYRANNHAYDTFLDINPRRDTGSFTNDFLYDYVYENKNFAGKNERGEDIVILQANKDQILSPVYKLSLDNYLQQTGTTNLVERKSFVGNDLNQAISAYKQGGLIGLQLGLQLTNQQGAVNQTNLNHIKDNLTNLLVMDGKLALEQNYGDQFSNPEILFRLIMKVLALFNNNSLRLDLTKLQDQIGDATGGTGGVNIDNEQRLRIVINTLLDQLFTMVLEEKPANLTWKFSTFELFSPELYWNLAWKPKSNADANIYEDASYDFNYFVLNEIFNNPENSNFYHPQKGFRYQIANEKNLYFAELGTDSLFPKFALELKTMNQLTDLNQLQMEKGNLATGIRFRDFVNKDRDRAVIPTIVITSAYFSANKVQFGDLIELPESGARSNLLLANRQPIESFLTGKIPFRIVGTGSKFDDLIPGRKFTPFLEDIEIYANGYVDNTLFSFIRTGRWNFTSTESDTFTTKFMFKNLWSSRDQIVDQLTINNLTGLTVYGPNSIASINDSRSVRQLNNLEALVAIFIILGVVVLILSFVFINFIIKKELNETRKQIGIFKSFGYKISELSWIFAIKTLITILAGILLGLVMSIPLQLYAIRLYIDNITFEFSHVYFGMTFLIILLIVVPLVFLGLSYLLTLQYLREPTLSLLNNGSRISKWTTKPMRILPHLSEKRKWFTSRLQRSFIRRSMGKFVVVQTLFAFASLSYTLMFGAQTLLYALVNQGFSALNAQTDHEFGWQNRNQLNISIDEDRFNIDDIEEFKNQNFEYIGFDNTKGIGETLNENASSSKARYRISLVINSFAREFDGALHNHALDLLMPEQYYFDRYVFQQDKNPNQTGANAVKILNKDYYLNWFFSLKISEFPNVMVENVQNNRPYNFSQIENYVRDNPGIRLDLDKALGEDSNGRQELEQELPKTIFGMKALDDQGLKNNMFLEDVTKIIILQLAEQNFDAQINNWLQENAFVQPNGWYSREDVLRAINYAKRTPLGQNFNPNDESYWGLLDNPLIDLSALTRDSSTNNASSPIGSGLDFSLSKLPPETISLIMSALMLKKAPENDINKNSVVTMNELLYNKDTEFLTYEIRMSSGSRDQTNGQELTEWINLRLFDTQSNTYGSFDNLLSHQGVSDATYLRLSEQLSDSKTINGIIPYGLARTYKLKVGDTFTLLTDTIHREEVKIKIIGINEDVSFYLGTGWPIDVDFTQFRSKFFNPDLAYLFDEGLPIFNKLYSQEPLLTGQIDVNDIASSINSMKFVGKNLSMAIDNDAAIFASVFSGMIDFSRIFNINVDSNFLLLTNPNIASPVRNSVVIPYNILRSGVNNIIDIVNNVLALFMVLLALLLLIILVVVMNIVIEEAAQIILTLRAIGYTSIEVNWIVMGSYIIGALISFVIAYLLSIAIWYIFLEVIGNLLHIYVFMRFSWQAPVITFLVIGTILIIGWVAANSRVNKTPLSRITNFG